MSGIGLCLLPRLEVLLRQINVTSGICDLQIVSFCKCAECDELTIYLWRSSSFSFWNLFKSFSTPALASLDILLRHLQRLFQLHQTLFRLANLISPRPFRIDVHKAMNSMSETAKYLIRHKVAPLRFLVRARRRGLACFLRSALFCRWERGRRVTMRGRKVRVKRCYLFSTILVPSCRLALGCTPCRSR